MTRRGGWLEQPPGHDPSLQDMVHYAPDGLLIVDGAGLIRFANQAAERLLARPAAALLGAPCHIPLQTGASPEWTVPGEDHRVVEVQTADATFRGEPARLVSLRDISDRKRKERQKDELLSKIAHELRTPLTSIRGSVTLLLSQALGALTGEQRDFLETISQDLDRLVRLLNNVLDLSKIEAGYMVLGRRPVDLAALVDQVCRSFQALFGCRRVARELGPVPQVYGDQNLLFQVLVNLVANAIKFTAESGAITFRLRAEGAWVALSVIDTGVGISREALGTLFQKYRQDPAVAPNRPRGTGLGLAICREIMELHHGEISVASEVGQGSTFTIRLPQYEPAQALQRLFDELAAARASSELNRTVLAIDVSELAPHAAAARRPFEDMSAECEQVVRRSIARADHLVALGPSLLVVLAQADRVSAQAMLKRLGGVCTTWAKQALGEPASVAIRLGVATSPEDGEDAAKLLEVARSRCHG